MSNALLYALKHGKQHDHTSIDDLESFPWVLFWSILSVTDAERHPSSEETAGLNELRSMADNLDARRIVYQDYRDGFCRNPAMDVFMPIITSLLEIAWAARDELKANPEQDMMSFTLKHYGIALTTGLKDLAKVPQTWAELFAQVSHASYIAGRANNIINLK